MLIDRKDNYLTLKFAYQPHLVAVVKNITGRKFDPNYKRWLVPVDHVEEVLGKLLPLGFTISGEVKNLRSHIQAHYDKLNFVRTHPELYTGSLPLYDFQKCGAVWLKESPSALLADVPGLGKTIQTISALEGMQNVLILAPASLKYGWKEEIIKWTPEIGPGSVNINVIDGKPEERARQWKSYSANVSPTWTIANYELLLRDFEAICQVPWDVIVCDEATRISNPVAKTVKLLKQIKAKKRIALTGTPISNTPVDIWSIIDWIRPGYLGNFTQFKDNYTMLDGWGSVVGYKDLDDLGAKIAPLMLRRTKDEVLTDFPPKVIEDVVFDLSDEEKKVYNGIKKQVLYEIQEYLDKIDTRSLGIIPVKMLRLKQVTGHLQLVGEKGESTKLATLKEMLGPIIASGEKVIIFTQFAEMAKLLQKEFINSYLIYGDIPSEERQRMVTSFNQPLSPEIMIMTEAGAYGLNLQAASYVFHYDAPWSIAKLMQREDRAHRIGQTKPVTVYNLIAKNTIDEYVAKVLYKKQNISVDILQDVERLEAAGIGEEDIKNILRI